MLYINYFIPVIMFGKSNYASIPATIPGNSNYASISKDGRKIFVVGDSYVSELEELILIKNLEITKFIFVRLAVQQVSSWIITPNLYSFTISQMLLSSV